MVFEYEITSNRVDCYSVIGIAREAAATFRKPFCPPVGDSRQEMTRTFNDYLKVRSGGYGALSPATAPEW